MNSFNNQPLTKTLRAMLSVGSAIRLSPLGSAVSSFPTLGAAFRSFRAQSELLEERRKHETFLESKISWLKTTLYKTSGMTPCTEGLRQVTADLEDQLRDFEAALRSARTRGERLSLRVDPAEAPKPLSLAAAPKRHYAQATFYCESPHEVSGVTKIRSGANGERVFELTLQPTRKVPRSDTEQ